MVFVVNQLSSAIFFRYDPLLMFQLQHYQILLQYWTWRKFEYSNLLDKTKKRDWYHKFIRSDQSTPRLELHNPHFATQSVKVRFAQASRGWIILHPTTPLLKDKMSLVYCYSYGRCSGTLHPVVLPVKTAQIYLTMSTESTHPHYLHIPLVLYYLQ